MVRISVHPKIISKYLDSKRHSNPKKLKALDNVAYDYSGGLVNSTRFLATNRGKVMDRRDAIPCFQEDLFKKYPKNIWDESLHYVEALLLRLYGQNSEV